ncbi:MAG: hypothetical protein RLZ94_841 [Actinomycetota bacterium]|jgi:hypothetical protein
MTPTDLAAASGSLLAPAAVFGAANTTAMLGWLALVVLPRRVRARRAIAGAAIPLLLAVAYSALIAAGWSRADGGFDSIAGVRSLFASDLALVAGWLHYLAFDLLVGTHIDERAERASIGRVALLPALALTFLVGPLGWLLYRVQEWGTLRMRGDGVPVVEVPMASGWVTMLAGAMRSADRRLLAIAGALLMAVPPTAMAVLLDDRTVDGANSWIKPLKFELSLAIYMATLAVLVPLAGPHAATSRWSRWMAWVAGTAIVVEMFWIILQAARAERSHFNTASPVEATMYGVMGLGAVLLVVMPLALVPIAWRSRSGGLRAGIVAGLLLNLLLGGVFGAILSTRESHFIGGDGTDATGLPFLGWSTTGGDLRIAHFIGLHALQGMLAAGIVTSAWRPRFGTGLVCTLAAAWAATTVVVATIALRGAPLPVLPTGERDAQLDARYRP